MSLRLHASAAESNNVSILEYTNISKAARVLRALNHRLRQQVIKTILKNKRLTVTQVYVKLRLEQSEASQHLAILRKAGVVNTERDGNAFTIQLMLPFSISKSIFKRYYKQRLVRSANSANTKIVLPFSIITP